MAALELMRRRQPLLVFESDSDADAEQLEALALRQLRMIQLMLTALIRQVWPDTTRLHNHLKLQFGADCVRGWLSRSKEGDILSGMQFSELALLVVDKKGVFAPLRFAFPQPDPADLPYGPSSDAACFSG